MDLKKSRDLPILNGTWSNIQLYFWKKFEPKESLNVGLLFSLETDIHIFCWKTIKKEKKSFFFILQLQIVCFVSKIIWGKKFQVFRFRQAFRFQRSVPGPFTSDKSKDYFSFKLLI